MPRDEAQQNDLGADTLRVFSLVMAANVERETFRYYKNTNVTAAIYHRQRYRDKVGQKATFQHCRSVLRIFHAFGEMSGNPSVPTSFTIFPAPVGSLDLYK